MDAAAGGICQREEINYDDYDCGSDFCDEDVSQNCQVGGAAGGPPLSQHRGLQIYAVTFRFNDTWSGKS